MRSAQRPGRRRLAALALVLLVSLAHLGLGTWWEQQRVGFGSGDQPIKAIDVRFVKALLPAPAAKAPPARHRARPVAPQRAPSPEAAALPPQPPASQADQADQVVAQAPPEAPAEAALDRPSAVQAPDGPQAPAASDTFEWPPSTLLRYDMAGNYRGPVQGWAEVRWLHEGGHYQVALEFRVPPLGGRRILSDGQVGPAGLSPGRYEQITEALLRSTVREALLFDGDTVQLANGRRLNKPNDVQDTASQFVQMTWLFTTQPELLRVGGAVEFALALPNRVAPWRYEVVAQEAINLPFGEVQAFHLQPAAGLVQPGEMAVETWVAPTLQYLPVRILVHLNSEGFLELNLKSPPLQEAVAPN